MRVVPTFLRAFVLALTVLATGLGITQAQVSETRGTMSLIEGRRYFVAFPQVWASPSEKPLNPAMMLFISSRQKATIRIQTTADINQTARIDREYTLEPNKILQVPISTSYMNTESESREGYGILVTGNRPISVFTYQAYYGNGELARHLPTEAWGKNYFTMNFYQDRYGAGSGYKYRPSQILVIAEKDNTVVTYTPTFATEGGRETPSVSKGSSQSVTLEHGETFLIKSKIDEGKNKDFESDLSGTWIRASKNIGVISGHTKVAIMRYPDVLPPTGINAAEAHFCRNNVHDAMLPIEMAGKKFVTIPTMYTANRVTGQGATEFGIDDDKGDVIRVVAIEDGTTIKKMRSDGTGLLNMWKINRGETRLETSSESAFYWESDKPILMGQYGKSYAKIIPPAMGKDGDATQGHPTVEAGMPMLEYVPSADRWASYGTFKAPEGMDNFLNIAFKASEIGKIKVDGKALNSAFGGSMQLLKGTEYAFIRTPIGVGDHLIESVTDNVKWAAWTYGSLDGLTQGRAYGTPVAIDLSIPCPDSLVVNETIVCGDVIGNGMIVPEGIACGSIFAVYAENLDNYELVVDAAFSSGDQKVNFFVNVVDKTKDATATVRVVTRSGKYVEKTYTYVSDKIDWAPKAINWGTIPFNTPVSKELTFINLSTTKPVIVTALVAKYFPNVYTFSPSSFTIPAGGTQKVTVTAIIQDSREKLDTVIAKLECYDKLTAELRVRGEEPLIYVGDQTWSGIPAQSPGVRKDVVIQNGSDVDLIITAYDELLLPFNDDGVSHFFSPMNLKDKLPITIHGGEKHTFSVMYSPRGDVSQQHRVDVPFTSNADKVDSIAVLIGDGVESNLAAVADPWIVRVIDNVQIAQNITKYDQQVNFFNYGTLAVTFSAPTIRGVDASNFSIVNNGSAGTFPVQLQSDGSPSGGANQSRFITVAFTPTELPNRGAERNNYKAELVFSTTDNASITKDVVVELNATAWQPQAKGADHDFGSFQSGAPSVTAPISITNDNYQDVSNPTSGDTKGTHNVIVTGIRFADATDPDNQYFIFENAPTPANPWRINGAAGDEEVLQVRFNPLFAGTFEARYEIITQPADMTDGAAPYTPVYTLKAVVRGGDFVVTNADAEQYVHNPRIMTVTVKHDELAVRRFTIGSPTGPDGTRFTVIEPLTGYIDVAPGQTATVKVEFIPDFVTKMYPGQTQQWLTDKGNPSGVAWRNGGFATEIVFTDESTGKTQTSQLTGNGIYLETTNFIKSDYSVKVGESIAVAVELDATPESINQPQLTELRVRISYDAALIRPTTKPGMDKIILDGTQMEGWNVKYTQVTDGMFELDLTAPAGGTPLTNNGVPAFKVNFDSYLAHSANVNALFISPINVYSYWVDLDQSGDRKEYTVIRDIPGQVTLQLDCAREMRLISVGMVQFAVKPVSPNPVNGTAVINYSIGIDGHTSIILYNSTGQRILDLVSEDQSHGEYELTVDLSELPTGTYYYQVVSGPYTSEPQVITIVK